MRHNKSKIPLPNPINCIGNRYEAGQNAPRRVSNQHNDCQEILQKFYQQQKQQQERLQGEQSRLKTLMSLNVPELFSAACNLKIRNTTTPGQMNQTLTNSRNDRRSCSQTGTVGSSWNSDAEHKLNEMINTELEAFYNYLVMVGDPQKYCYSKPTLIDPSQTTLVRLLRQK